MVFAQISFVLSSRADGGRQVLKIGSRRQSSIFQSEFWTGSHDTLSLSPPLSEGTDGITFRAMFADDDSDQQKLKFMPASFGLSNDGALTSD